MELNYNLAVMIVFGAFIGAFVVVAIIRVWRFIYKLHTGQLSGEESSKEHGFFVFSLLVLGVFSIVAALFFTNAFGLNHNEHMAYQAPVRIKIKGEVKEITVWIIIRPDRERPGIYVGAFWEFDKPVYCIKVDRETYHRKTWFKPSITNADGVEAVPFTCGQLGE